MKAKFINPIKVSNQKYYDLIFENENDEIIYRGHISFEFDTNTNEMEMKCLEIAENIFVESGQKIIIQEIKIYNPESWQF